MQGCGVTFVGARGHSPALSSDSSSSSYRDVLCVLRSDLLPLFAIESVSIVFPLPLLLLVRFPLVAIPVNLRLDIYVRLPVGVLLGMR